MAGPVDVYITAVPEAGVGGTPVIANMQFPNVTNPYLQLTPGTLEVQVTPAGNPSKVLAMQPFSLGMSGKVYSIFFLDPPNGSAAIDPPTSTTEPT